MIAPTAKVPRSPEQVVVLAVTFTALIILIILITRPTQIYPKPPVDLDRSTNSLLYRLRTKGLLRGDPPEDKNGWDCALQWASLYSTRKYRGNPVDLGEASSLPSFFSSQPSTAMSTPTDSVSVLQNGITSILDAINNLIPVWSTTADNLDSTAQAVTQLATVAHVPKVEIAVSQTTVPLPDEYKGAKEKAAYFVRACNQYFTRIKETQDDVRIATALALMKGDKASKWAENQLEFIQEGHADALVTWKEFCKEFVNHFGDRTPDFTAASKIKLLVMGTKSADEYNTDFNNLKNDTKWNEAALLDRYQSGLDPELLISIYRCDPMPVTLREWQEKAELLDKKAKELKMQAAQGIKPIPIPDWLRYCSRPRRRRR
ncbi:hypothetical protein D9615_004727 [Tricholomella constricta]|uniref:Retrotransposon gag domain-containing protein n=1 Tax=Tricholomella constricta TaxID=117010 RepID=A0A8H5HBZ2_9AGAR|nr:hypothetical protein D9615_004727 [Tricholomella constricta]